MRRRMLRSLRISWWPTRWLDRTEKDRTYCFWKDKGPRILLCCFVVFAVFTAAAGLCVVVVVVVV